MQDDTQRIVMSAARSIESLAPAVSGLEHLGEQIAAAGRAAERGYFSPDEDDLIRERFGRYLGARAALFQTLEELIPLAAPEVVGSTQRHDRDVELRAFTLAYTVACLLVAAAQIIVRDLATHTLVQRKLNEPSPRFGIPPKQYTLIYRSLVDPWNMWRMLQARRYADKRRGEITALFSDSVIAPVLPILHRAEANVSFSKRGYLRTRIVYRAHALRRRGKTSFQGVMFALFEITGRVIADLKNPLAPCYRRGPHKQVTDAVRAELAALLQPGDVMITRHEDALSNLFLPGYWPHSALFIGPAAEKQRLVPHLSDERAARWVDPRCVLEARKDGVLFRQLDDTLAVDAVAIIRPMLDPSLIARGIARAVEHEGKLYDFDFDFFRNDRLVCTEVAYRAYDGLGEIAIALTHRAGRPTLAAQDLLRLAARDQGFTPVAVFCPADPAVARRDDRNVSYVLHAGQDARAALNRTCGET